MKAVLLLFLPTTALFTTYCDARPPFPEEIITPEDERTLDLIRHNFYLDAHKNYGRPKRSGSGDILNHIKYAVAAGIKKKLGQLAKSSAGASAHFSSSLAGGSSTYAAHSSLHGSGYSSAHHVHNHHPHFDHDHPPETYDHPKHFDFWSLKKSILNTLLQAVKAIKGGVIAIKGQLIKGGGKLISYKGKLISAKGEAITNLGKNLAASAVLVPHGGHPTTHEDYDHPPHYDHAIGPSGNDEVYHGSPSAPGPEYHHTPDHYHHSGHGDDLNLPPGAHAGILILKKIPKDVHEAPPTGHPAPTAAAIATPHHNHHLQQDHQQQQHSGPGIGTVFSKFITASTSLDPSKPALFGTTGSTHSVDASHLHDHHSHSISPHEPAPPIYQSKAPASTHFSSTGDKDYLPSAPTGPPSGTADSDDLTFEKEPPNINYGDFPVPVPSTEYKPDDLNNHNLNLNKLKGTGTYEEYPALNSYQVPLKSHANPNLDLPTELLNSFGGTTHTRHGGGTTSHTSNHNNYDEVGSHNNPLRPTYSNYQQDLLKPYLSIPSTASTAINFHGGYQHYPSLPSTFGDDLTHASSAKKYNDMPFSGVPPINQVPPKPKRHRGGSGGGGGGTKSKTKNANYDVVKSVTYELGPNGPKRLT